MRTLPTLVLLLASLLAGCSSSGPVPTDPGEAANAIPLEVTADTGVIRGVVVDTGVRPLANVLVTVVAGELRKSANTTDSGAFGFDGLAPGTYFVKASKPGFRDGQTSVEVAAGVPNPPLARIALEPDASTRPYVVPVVTKGFIECNLTLGVASHATCSEPNGLPGCGSVGLCNVTQDAFLFTVPVDRRPAHLQSEMMWDSTQAAGRDMSLSYSYDCGAVLYCNFSVRGASPLLLAGNQTILETTRVGAGADLLMRVFSTYLDETRPPAPVDSTCAPVPSVGTFCPRGLGAVVEQRFAIFTHLFYGYTPPEWRFSSGTDPPAPPA